MKKIYSLFLICVACFSIKATTYTVTAAGTSFTPNTLTVSIGDMVMFVGASVTHPTAQVDGTTWAANGTTTLSTGWGVKTANFTYTATSAGTIYYVCQNHVSFGMKGTITVSPTGVNEHTSVLQDFNLFPNPASTEVKIGFSLNGSSNVSVKMFNLIGQEVSTLSPAASLGQGNYNFIYNIPATLPEGTYFLIVNADNKILTKKMVISK